MASTIESTIRATASAFIMEFDGEWHSDTTQAQRAPECLHVILPSSLNVPMRTNEEFREYIKGVGVFVRDVKMRIDDVIVVPSELRAVCRSSMTSTTPVGPFQNEYVWFFKFNESGDKIVHITEFLDSQASAKILSQLKDGGHLKGH